MEEFLELLATLIIEESNFRVLHWNAAGKSFDRIHKLASDAHATVSGHVDDIAEIVMMLDGSTLNYTEALEVANSRGGIGIANTEEYDYEEYVNTSKQMYEAILDIIQDVLDTDICKNPKNVGIKATIESMHMEYDKQLRYLTSRREK